MENASCQTTSSQTPPVLPNASGSASIIEKSCENCEIGQPANGQDITIGKPFSEIPLADTLRGHARKIIQGADLDEIGLLELLKRVPGLQIDCVQKFSPQTWDPIGWSIEINGAIDDKILQAFDFFCRPCGPEIAAREITRLRLTSVRRAESEADIQATFSIYAQELASYPADIVRKITREWALENKFFPSLSEIIAKARQATSWRLSVREALRRAENVAPAIAKAPRPKHEVIPEAQRVEIAKDFNERIGCIEDSALIGALKSFAKSMGIHVDTRDQEQEAAG